MASFKDVLAHVPDWRQHIPLGAHKVLSKIERCHTAALGYHTYKCQNSACEKIHLQYHACRNRHCPHCGYARVQEWMDERLRELLPTRYFHVVFTLPAELRPMAWRYRKLFFDLLFDASAHCLLTLSRDPKYLGATPAITTVLHTWGQQLQFHPHVHCIVSGGGADANNQWHKLKKGFGDYLFPYNVMMPLFRGYFLDHLNRMILRGEVQVPEGTHWPSLRDRLYKTKWAVYAKSPVQSPDTVVEYLARYTHPVTMFNQTARFNSVHSSINIVTGHRKLPSAITVFVRWMIVG
ncbi:MAG: transposase [Cryomorphaceae bacterium]|nr:transposase [Cryomorphaceae bacterium]